MGEEGNVPEVFKKKQNTLRFLKLLQASLLKREMASKQQNLTSPLLA